jgi:DHA2 family multidrug resistance protein
MRMGTDAISAGPVSARAPSHRPIFAVAAVLLGSFVTGFDSRFLAIGLPDLRGAFGLGFDEGAWLATLGIGSQIIVAPAVPWLVTAFGVRRVIIPAALFYAAISQVLPYVRDVPTLWVLAALHGLALGAFIPATLMIILRNLEVRWWLPALAIYAFRLPFAQNAGVALVGFYVEHVGWQALYGQQVILSLLMVLLILLGTPHEPVNDEVVARGDWGGMLLLGVGVAMLYAGLDQGNRVNWLESGMVMSLLAGGVVLLIGFFINESVVRDPWAHASVLFSRNVAIGVGIILVYAVTSLSNALLVPNFLINVAQLRPEQISELLLPYCVVPLVLVTVAGIWLLRRFDARLLIAIGFAAFALAAWLGGGLTQAWRLNDFIPMVLLQAVGQGLTFFAALVFILSNANPARATAFSAYIQVIRIDGTEIGSALMATWVRVREQLHSNLLGLHVGAGDSDTSQTLAQLSGSFTRSFSGEGAMARGIASLAARVQREANVLAYIDAFQVAFWAAIVGLLLVSLFGPAPPGPLSPKRAA